MRKTTTIAPKKPSATDAKLRAPTTEDTTLSPIKEEDSQLPEVQGSSNTDSNTLESMEPLSELQKDFFQSCLQDNNHRMEEDRREERRSYQETITRMQDQMQEMREDYDTLRRSRSSPVIELTSPKHAFETPKVQRPQDKAYQEILTASKHKSHHDESPTNSFRNPAHTITPHTTR